MECAALQRSQSFAHELLAAIDQARSFCAVLQRTPRDVVVVRFIRLTEIGGIAIRDRTLLPHPVDRGAGVESAGERDADTLADRQGLKNICHVVLELDYKVRNTRLGDRVYEPNTLSQLEL